MSSDADALVRALVAAPADDTPRLAYADWLDDNHDPARADFIRAQCALAHLADHDPARRSLEDREHDLLAEHETRWLGTDPAGLQEWEFRRGFVHEVAASPFAMAGPGRDVLRQHPVVRWRVLAADTDLPEDLLAAGRAGWFPRLEAVDLSGWNQTVGQLERFLTRADAARLADLDLSGLRGLDDLPGVLRRCGFRGRLAALRVGGRYNGEAGHLDVAALIAAFGSARLNELAVPACLLTAADLGELLAAAPLAQLASLDVRDNQIEPDGGAAFRRATCRLKSLDLSGTAVGAFNLADVLAAPAAGDLHTLELNRCGSAVANGRAVAGSRFWANARELRMHSATVPGRAFDPLFNSRPGPPGLYTLDVGDNYLRDDGLSELAGAAWAGSLGWLAVGRNYLGDGACRAVAAGPFARLRTLHLSYNRADPDDDGTAGPAVTDAGVAALADAPSLANLRLLTLSGTAVTTAGAAAALHGRHWRLTGLGLAGCAGLTADVVRVLSNSPRLWRLNWLDLSYNPTLGGDALLPLAESEYLCPLTELDLGGVGVSDRVRAAFAARLGRRLSG